MQVLKALQKTLTAPRLRQHKAYIRASIRDAQSSETKLPAN